MSTIQSPSHLWEEIAELFASTPDPSQVLEFRPSEIVQNRATELLTKANATELTEGERREVDQLDQAETLMRLVKARIRAQNAK